MLKFDKDPQTNGGNFLKLKDGESVTGILRGEVKVFYITWEGGKSSEVPEGTPGAKFRFRVNLVVAEKDGVFVPKILEQGAMVYKAFKDLSEDYSLDETIIKIKRTGSGQNNTEYSVMPLPKKPEAATLKKLEALELLPLESEQKEEAPAVEPETPF